jgi:hypothetical protein
MHSWKEQEQGFSDQLPKTWNGVEVVNGDDLRFLDKKGVVVGLIEKAIDSKLSLLAFLGN